MPIPPFQIPCVGSRIGKHTCCLDSFLAIANYIIMIPVGLDIIFSGAIVFQALVDISGWVRAPWAHGSEASGFSLTNSWNSGDFRNQLPVSCCLVLPIFGCLFVESEYIQLSESLCFPRWLTSQKTDFSRGYDPYQNEVFPFSVSGQLHFVSRELEL